MADTDTTTNVYTLNKPAKGKQDWDVPLNENFDFIDTGLACARTHFRRQTIPFAAALTIKPIYGNARGLLQVTDNITSMEFDWSDVESKTKPGNFIVFELQVVPSEGVSIVWPTNVLWINGAVPRLNGTKVLRILFEYDPSASNLRGSFMGWEG